ncbi:MAG: bifunctional 4-hydroxy-2-oxoglutarate aldolase/2-dehydro-3-deoxy-phosphogluconate aldolase [Blastocatellia bacterium]
MGRALEMIGAGRVVTILRGDFGGREEEIVGVLAGAGITAVEVTLNSPGALATIGRLAARFGDQLAVGAGTVLTAEEVERVADAGGEFIVSPNRDQRVIGRTKQLGLASLPGCFTPSEIVEALDAGADAIKLFPVQPLGIDFVRAIQGPFPGLRLVPTGGVTPEMAQRYYAAGAWAVGVGSELMRGPLTSESDFDTLRVRVLGYLGGGVGRG